MKPVDDQSTCQDITDVFDDESTLAMDPTITLESDNIGSVCDEGEDPPELPIDSRHSTPAHSSRETSRESTPMSKRRKHQNGKVKSSPRKITSTTSLMMRELEMENLRNYQATIPTLDESIDTEKMILINNEKQINEINSCDNSLSQTSGYKSDDFLPSTSTKSNKISDEKASPTSSPKSNSSTSSRQRRLEEQDRFKTHTITKSDLSATSTEGDTSNTVVERDMSCQGLKIGNNDRKVRNNSEKFNELDFLETEANLVLDAILVGKENARSRSSSADLLKQEKSKVDPYARSRSVSIEILDDYTLQNQQFDVGSCTLERKSLKDIATPSPGMIHRGARISKPTETEQCDLQDDTEKVHGIRGRRKPLYCSPTKNQNRCTIPPTIPPNKPSLAPKPRNIPSGITARSHLNDHISSPRQRPNGSPPAQVRSTRAQNLRQMNSHNRKGSPPSPKISPRSIGTASDRSYRSGSGSASSLTKSPVRTISPRSSSSASITRPSVPFVRQGTFTKEEGTSPVKNIPIVDIDIGETSSTTSTYSSNTNSSITRLSSIPVAGPMKNISPGNQASNRRYTAPSRSPRSVGSQSSLEDVQRSGKHSNSSSGSSIKIHQTRTSALRERSASKQGHVGRNVGEQNSVMRTTSISSTSSIASSRSSKSSLRPSNSIQGLKTVAEGGHSVIPVPTKRSPSSSAIEFKRRFASDNSQNQPNKLQNASVTTPSNNGSPGLKYHNELER